MNKIKLAIIGAVLSLTAVINAQNTAPIMPPITAVEASTNSSGKITDDLKHVAVDAWDALKSANFANGVTVEPFGLYHSGDYGGGIAIATASTNGVNVGFAVAAIDEKVPNKKTGGTKSAFAFYDATLSIQLGKQVTVPVLNIPAYLYVESGPALNLAHPNTILEQSIAGAKIFFAKGKGSVGVGVGQNSEWSTPFYVAHFGWTF